MEPTSVATPPASALPVDAPASIQPTPDAPQGSKRDLFPGADKKPEKTQWVTLTDGKRYLFAACKPGEMAWISNQCFIRKPDPESTPEKPRPDIFDWDSTKRGFLMVAVGAREPNGTRMYPGTVDNPDMWIVGCEQWMYSSENEDYERAFGVVNELTGFGKGKLAAEKKD